MYRRENEWKNEKGEIIMCEECSKTKAIRREEQKTKSGRSEWWYLCSGCFLKNFHIPFFRLPC